MTRREEAILDLEVVSFDAPRTFFDVTARYCVPAEGDRLAAAARDSGAVAREAERSKRLRYPDGQTPWRAVPLVSETGGRLGATALKHLRKLARKLAARLGNEGEDDADAASHLVQKWGSWLSVALQRANAAVVSSALGREKSDRHLAEQLRSELAS